jgi:cupin 2 domain-containing protein
MENMKIKNIFENVHTSIPDELFEEIDSTNNIKVERIISDGHNSPEDFWYDQEKNELVFLLQGSAVIEYENGDKIKLMPGDYVKISAHEKHRVAKTSNTGKTIWLAIHYY